MEEEGFRERIERPTSLAENTWVVRSPVMMEVWNLGIPEKENDSLIAYPSQAQIHRLFSYLLIRRYNI